MQETHGWEVCLLEETTRYRESQKEVNKAAEKDFSTTKKFFASRKRIIGRNN